MAATVRGNRISASALDVRIVTTFNPREWSTFVRHNLESVLDFLPYEVVAYHEGEKPDLDHHRLVWRNLHDVPGADEFIAEAGRFPPARGQFEKYDYNFDAHKFSRKVYAQCDAAEERGEILIWLDSDVEAVGPLSVGRIENLMLGMPMARYARPELYTETGIVFWDLRQSETVQFFKHYRHLYDSRRVYTLAGGWHDCWAMDAVIKALSLPSANLTRRHTQLEVVSTSELANVFRHDKGNRKYAAA